jgi:hypothetical protein
MAACGEGGFSISHDVEPVRVVGHLFFVHQGTSGAGVRCQCGEFEIGLESCPTRGQCMRVLRASRAIRAALGKQEKDTCPNCAYRFIGEWTGTVRCPQCGVLLRNDGTGQLLVKIPSCVHNWKPVGSDVGRVTGDEICTKCGALRPIGGA